MKRLLYLAFVLASYLMYAQGDVSEIEYYFDTDPGIGNGISIDIDPDVEILNQNFDIPTTGLPIGNHKLFVRAVKDDGSASYYYSQSFSIRAANATFNSADIDGFEYYFNTDPGIGNGTQLTVTDSELISESFSIPTGSLSTGSHRLFIRTKNSDGSHSEYDNVAFSISNGPAVFNSNDIVAAEYYFDTDPGTGNATNISIPSGETLNENLAILTNTMPQGNYRAFLRVKNTNDDWSMYDRVTFSVVPLAGVNMADINTIEYFFNTDPGIGLGNNITITDAETVNQNVAIPTASLSTGTHRLYIRVGNTNGTYSLFTHNVISVKTPAFFNTVSIVAAEYFIDIDPGIGNANTIVTSGDDIDEDFVVTTSGSLAMGDHYVYVRVQNSDGTWSLLEKQHFEIEGTLSMASEIISEISIYPNPTQNILNFKLPNNTIIESVELIDMNGKRIFHSTEALTTMDLSNVSNGVYLLQLKTNIGKLSKRIVKQ
ncbi:T9SS type A sorting domain-containing protein [Psychroserpens sp. XS_ASV72]|uniref:T9SS type A sorting domain-containing protein n=1 Tax=Psychroserpens sp. XS_ASV72 TaxID=3241293 RepID=UPI003518B88E